MARIVKEVEYNAKRGEILEVALRLVYTRGYQQMTIQDILDELKISKGALYHYFDSKHALLEALVDRMEAAAEQTILPIIHNPDLSALQKLQAYFDASASWKSGQKELITSLMRMWYTDDNALIRQKLTAASLKNTPRLFEPIINQGIAENVFSTSYPEQVAVIMAGIALSLTDSFIELLLAPQADSLIAQKTELILAAYVDSIERILGAAPGSMKRFQADALKDWWGIQQPAPESK